MAQKSFATSLLKGLALTVGGGVALGVGIKIGQGAPLADSSGAEGASGPELEPVIDRLNGIENRMMRMESVLSEQPGVAEAHPGEPLHHALGDLESRLSSHGSDVESLRRDIRVIDERSSERISQFGKTVDDLHSRLPVLVEQTVGACFQQMEEKLQREIEATHTRTLETFVDNIQTKVVQRISAFETDLAGQAEAMTQLREYSLKTDQNMQRLLVGVDRLASEIARKTDAPASVPPAASAAAFVGHEPDRAAEPLAGSPKPDRVSDQAPEHAPEESVPNFIPNSFLEKEEVAKSAGRWRIPLIFGILVLAIASFVGWQLYSQSHISQAPAISEPKTESKTAQSEPPQAAPSPSGAAPAGASAATTDASRIETAREYARGKDYAKAEAVYRSILKTDSKNREVALALADVLYRQQKFEESAAVLKSLSTRANPQ